MKTKSGEHPKVAAAFRDLLPAVGAEVLAGLEAAIAAEGCRDPLVVWKEKGILLDGHRRLAICRRLGKPYRTVARSFASEDAAKRWARANQRDRRNLTPDQLAYLAGLEYEAEKRAEGRPEKLAQNETVKGATDQQLAAEKGVSRATVARNARFARSVDALEAAAPGSKAVALGGTVSRARTIAAATVLADNPRLAPAAVAGMLAGNGRAAARVQAAPSKARAPDVWLERALRAEDFVGKLVTSIDYRRSENVTEGWGGQERRRFAQQMRILGERCVGIADEIENRLTEAEA